MDHKKAPAAWEDSSAESLFVYQNNLKLRFRSLQ